MRPIQFRGRKSDGTWLYGDLNHIGGKVYIFPITDEELGPYHHYEVQPETVGQFTGLKDKNETPIFEGDIVKSKQAVNGQLLRFLGAVVWTHHKLQWQVEGTRNWRGARNSFDYDMQIHAGVIGSIHDNPSLLNP